MLDRTVVFTGTSKQDITPPQGERLRQVLRWARRFYHGRCIRADEQAARMCRALNADATWIEAFPGNIPGMTAEDTPDDQRHAPAPPLERNRTMIDDAIRSGDPLCVATPKTMQEELRSGTWATIRYARKRGVPVYICWPDGSHTYEPGGLP